MALCSRCHGRGDSERPEQPTRIPTPLSSACAAGVASCIPLVITDPSKGVIANDVNVYGVELSTPPTSGTLTCNAVPGNPVPGICANGTFTYTPTACRNGTEPHDSFGYCANGAAAGAAGLCTTVTLSASALAGGKPAANNITYTSKIATFLKIPSPGVLSVDSDPNGLPLQVVLSSVTPSGLQAVTINMDPQGGFTATRTTSAGTVHLYLHRAKLPGKHRASPATVTLIFPTPSNLQVKVLDAQAYNNCNGNSACIGGLAPFPDYRWIIEEDKTFWVDPNCTANSSITTPGCPSRCGPSGTEHHPHLWRAIPHQQHGLRRPGLHRAALVRRRPDHARHPAGLYLAGRSSGLQCDRGTARPGGVRPRQRRLPA